MKYPIGQQNFQFLRSNGFVYIDKTDLIYNLVNENKYVFLSRPRRFGKSLVLSTIQAYFEGKNDLFNGLAIENLEKDWNHYPVFHLEFSKVNNSSHSDLIEEVQRQIADLEKKYEIPELDMNLGSRFANLIKNASEKTGKQVVILIDEYDSPLINTLHDEKLHEQNRSLLKSVYSNLKGLDAYIQFAMLTGVSRFSKMNVFSGLNNLNDISFEDKYAALCGFTLTEISETLKEGVEKLSDKLKISKEETLLRLKQHYDGYHFSIECPDIYNPFSLLKCLQQSKFSPFWLETGTPTFLVEALKKSFLPFSRIFNSEAKETALAESDTSFQSPVALLYQTGYLTIKGFDQEKERYILGVPNKEVENGLFTYLLGGFTVSDTTFVDDVVGELKKEILEGNVDEFLKLLQTFLAGIPTFASEEKTSEKYFEHTLYLIFRTMGLKIASQVATSFSRSDLIVETPSHLYIFELKTQGTAQKALQQIEEKEYDLPYRHLGKKIVKIGLIFSKKKRNITKWAVVTN